MREKWIKRPQFGSDSLEGLLTVFEKLNAVTKEKSEEEDNEFALLEKAWKLGVSKKTKLVECKDAEWRRPWWPWWLMHRSQCIIIRMSESTLSAWSLSIHVPRGGCGGGSIPQSFGFAVLVYIFAKMYLNTYFLTSLGCSIGIHLPKMCASTKFPMFSFVRGSNPGACTNTWETRETHEKKRENSSKKHEIHEKNMKFMKKTWNSWKQREIHEKNVTFMKKTWNLWKKRGIHEKKREIHEKKSETHEKKRRIHGKKREIHEKNVEFMEKNVKFRKTTWNSKHEIREILSETTNT